MKGGNKGNNTQNGSVDESSISANKEEIKERVKRHVKDTRLTLGYADEGLTEIGDKKDFGGVSKGHVAQDELGRRHMIKPFRKKSYRADFVDVKNGSAETEWWDNIREFIAGDIFSLLIYGKAPNVGLVKIDDNTVAARSRFLEDSTTLNDFYNDSKNDYNQVMNAEKIIAACLIMGDPDFHSKNVMVHPNPETGQYELDKIDYGRSFLYKNRSAIEWLQVMLYSLNHHHDKRISGNYMLFHLSVFRDALKEMATRVTPDMVADIVDRKVYALKQAGVEIGDSERAQIELNVKQGLIKQICNIQAQVAFLDFLKEHEPSVFLNFIRDAGGKEVERAKGSFADFIQDALNNGEKLYGVNPLILGAALGLKVNGTSYIEHMTTMPQYQSMIDSGVIEYAMYNNIEVAGKDAVEYAVEKGIKIEGKDAVVYASENSIEIEGKDAVVYALEKGIKINEMLPEVYALQHNYSLAQFIQAYPKGMMLKMARIYGSDVSQDIKEKAEDVYNDIAAQYLGRDQSANVVKSDVFKGADAYTIARKMDKRYVEDKSEVVKIGVDNIIYNCDIEVAAKMLEVGRELKKMRNEPFSLESAFNAIVDAVSEMWKKVTGQERLSMEDLGKALNGIAAKGHAEKFMQQDGAQLFR